MLYDKRRAQSENKPRGNPWTRLTRRTIWAPPTPTQTRRGIGPNDAGKPRMNRKSPMVRGSDGAAIKVGQTVRQKRRTYMASTARSGLHDRDDAIKLRAQIMAGDPPAASQLKGTEIAGVSKISRRPRPRPGRRLRPNTSVSSRPIWQKCHKALRPLDRPLPTWQTLPHQHSVCPKKEMASRLLTAIATTWAGGVQKPSPQNDRHDGNHPPAWAGHRWRRMKGRSALTASIPAAYRRQVMETRHNALMRKRVLDDIRS